MRQKLRQALYSRRKCRITDHGLVSAAVLIPVYYNEGQYYLLFAKRTQTVREHKGQISFPGGVYEEEDGTLLATALRESAEEIGLSPGDAEVVGELDDTVTVTNYVISPFVAFIPWPYRFTISPEEVEHIIDAPVSALLNKECLREESDVIDGKSGVVYFYHYEGKVIWGATARILNQFLGIWANIA